MPIVNDLEADGGKPFNAEARDAKAQAPAGEPVSPTGQPPASAFASLGLTPPPSPVAPSGAAPVAPATPKPNPLASLAPGIQPEAAPPQPTVPATPPNPGEKRVEEYSAAIQKNAEEAYAWGLHRAMTDPETLDQMIASKNPIDQKIAEKILERNAEHFGAGSIQEFLAKKTIDDAGADPRDRELAQLKINQNKLLEENKNRAWNDWKRDNGVKNDEFGKMCDQIRRDYPNSPESDVVSIARGRAGIKPQGHVPEAPLAPSGSRGAPGNEGTQIDRGLMGDFRLDDSTVRSATAYFEAVGARGR